MQNDNKSVAIWVVIVLVVLLLVGYAVYYLRPQPLESPSGAVMVPKEDSVAAIDSEIQGMSVDGLDSELADIDKELR